jgi:hypothetical protein
VKAHYPALNTMNYFLWICNTPYGSGARPHRGMTVHAGGAGLLGWHRDRSRIVPRDFCAEVTIARAFARDATLQI